MTRYRYYNAGKFNGKGEDLYLISFYRDDMSPGSCLCVEASKLAAELAAIERNGWEAV